MVWPVLVAPDLDREMQVEVDASEYATGGILLMRYEDDKWRPVAFILKSLNKVKRNYEILNREMLMIIRCLDKWRHLLEGAQNRFEIWSNHKNLEYFMSKNWIVDKQDGHYTYLDLILYLNMCQEEA